MLDIIINHNYRLLLNNLCIAITKLFKFVNVLVISQRGGLTLWEIYRGFCPRIYFWGVHFLLLHHNSHAVHEMPMKFNTGD